MKQSLQLRIGQSLTMTPQLQQAIKLLQLSSLELQSEIQQSLETNPLLDQEDNFGEITLTDPETGKEDRGNGEDLTDFKAPASTVAENRAEQRLPDDLEIDARWDQIYDNLPTSASQPASMGSDNRDLFENQAGEVDTLTTHLVWQLDCSHLSPLDHEIGLAIIDSIDDSGYLTQPISDIHEGLLKEHEGLELDEIEAVLHLVQRFDPVGVAASSPSECMAIQLEQYDPETPHLAKATGASGQIPRAARRQRGRAAETAAAGERYRTRRDHQTDPDHYSPPRAQHQPESRRVCGA